MNGATMLWRAAFDRDAAEPERFRTEPWPNPFAVLAAAVINRLRAWTGADAESCADCAACPR